MSFAPGDEVVCVDDVSLEPQRANATHHFIKAGKHYFIRGVMKDFVWPNGDVQDCVVFLHGIVRKAHDLDDVPFRATRFRPVKRESIEAFKKFAADIGKKVRASTTPYPGDLAPGPVVPSAGPNLFTHGETQ